MIPQIKFIGVYQEPQKSNIMDKISWFILGSAFIVIVDAILRTAINNSFLCR